jgi:molecular chaperone HtpG
VSRSYLQGDPNVRKISNHITKKVADKLEELFKENRENFEAKWDDIKVFIEYGIISEANFYDRAKKFLLFKDCDSKYHTMEEYETLIGPAQRDKDGNLIYLYASNYEEQYAYIQSAKERGYNVLLMDGVLDTHFINNLEQKLEKSRFLRVDSDTVEKLIRKEEPMPSKLNDDQQKALKEIMEKQIDTKKFMINFESLSETDAPLMIIQPEFLRRMKDMAALSGGTGFMGDFPEQYTLVVNSNNPVISKVLLEPDGAKQASGIRQLFDLALLSQNLLKGKELNDFVKRSIDIFF